MALIPSSRPTRTVWAVWLTACLGVLAFAFQSRAIHEAQIGLTVVMILLTFPIGCVVAGAIGLIFNTIDVMFGVTAGDSFAVSFGFWIAAVAAGHLQWFVVLPAIIRWARRKRVPSAI